MTKPIQKVNSVYPVALMEPGSLKREIIVTCYMCNEQYIVESIVSDISRTLQEIGWQRLDENGREDKKGRWHDPACVSMRRDDIRNAGGRA